MKLTFCGHSAFLLETGGKKLLFDPFLSGNPLVKKALDAGGGPEKLPHLSPDTIEADYLLLSHGHGDHVGDAEPIARRTGAMVLSNFEVVTWLENKGISKYHPFNHGGKARFDFGTVKYVNAIHSSGLPDGAQGGNPGGFVVWNDEGCFYFAGDTALTMDMKLIPLTCPKLDFAILPIGDNFTMGHEEALIASDFVECARVVGCHYDTFGYIVIDQAAAKKAFADKGKELILLKIGETISL
jgi:L-ascorbate metabolism protein UlaG (beta-lactamase superfamily)